MRHYCALRLTLQGRHTDEASFRFHFLEPSPPSIPTALLCLHPPYVCTPTGETLGVPEQNQALCSAHSEQLLCITPTLLKTRPFLATLTLVELESTESLKWRTTAARTLKRNLKVKVKFQQQVLVNLLFLGDEQSEEEEEERKKLALLSQHAQPAQPPAQAKSNLQVLLWTAACSTTSTTELHNAQVLCNVSTRRYFLCAARWDTATISRCTEKHHNRRETFCILWWKTQCQDPPLSGHGYEIRTLSAPQSLLWQKQKPASTQPSDQIRKFNNYNTMSTHSLITVFNTRSAQLIPFRDKQQRYFNKFKVIICIYSKNSMYKKNRPVTFTPLKFDFQIPRVYLTSQASPENELIFTTDFLELISKHRDHLLKKGKGCVEG